MIKASELRVGNKVLIDGKIYTVETISNNPFELYVEGIDYNYSIYAEPIPLTPEIIESLGGLYKVGLMTIGSNYSDSVRYFWDAEGHIIGEEIKYVHELQNIYFAIHRKELTINLHAAV